MARRITSEDLVLNLILDADKVDKGSREMRGKLNEMDRETQKLRNQLKGLEVERKKLNKTDKDYEAQLKSITQQMKNLRTQISANETQMNAWRRQIGISGLTINQLRSHLAALRVQLNNAVDPGQLRNIRRQIQQTTDQIERMTTGMSRMAQAWRKMGTMANQFGTLFAWLTLVFYGLSRAIRSTTQNTRQLDRMFSNVMKTTAMTRGEMMALKKEFDQLNSPEIMRTPTKTMELLDIARIAGRLGIRGVENIRDFTLAVDKLYVSLSTDLEGSSVAEVAEQVGKMVNVFGLVGKEGLSQSEAMLRMGSLINELGKSSEASAGNILKFITRMGGMGSVANFTADQLAGIAATLDATGVASERGSTSVVKLLSGLGKHVDKFSRLLGITADEYTEWVKRDANEVFLALLDLSAKGNESIIDVVQKMGDMEVSGVRVAEVFGKLVQNIDMVRKQQEIASRAFESSASILNEYYIVSRDWDSLMAIQGKRIKNLGDEYSRSLTPVMYRVYRLFIDLMYGIRDFTRWVGQNIDKILGLTAVFAALRATKIVHFFKESVIVMKLWFSDTVRATKAAWSNIAAVKAMHIAYVKAGGGIAGVTAAMKALWLTMWKNPVTTVIAIIGVLAGALLIFRQRVDAVTKAQAKLNAQMLTQGNDMKMLFDALKKTNEGSEERRRLIGMINEAYGSYLPNLLSERDSVEAIGDAYEYANQKLKEKIALDIKNDILDKEREKTQKKIERKTRTLFLGSAIKKSPVTAGAAIADFNELQDKIITIYNETGHWSDSLIDSFIEKYKEVLITSADGRNVDLVESSRSLIKGVIEDNMQFIEQIQSIDAFTKAYVKTTQEIAEGAGGDIPPGILLDEQRFTEKKREAEIARDTQRLALMQMGMDKERYRKQELKLEEVFLRKMLELTRQRFTNTRGELIGGDKEILDAEIALQQNLLAQEEDGGKKRAAKAKDEFLATEVMLMEALDKQMITRKQFDKLMLEMQGDFYSLQIAKAKLAGDDYLDLEKKWYQNRLEQRKLFEKEQVALQQAMRYAFSIEPEDTVKADDDLVANLIARRKRVRQFMGLERDAEWEKEFAVFETEDFEGQLEQLRAWYNEGVLSHQEYERRKTDITRAQTNNRLKLTGDVMNATNGMLAAAGQLFAAQKDEELKEAGNNEKKKLEIQKKYAEKEKAISIAQATISGAMAIMRILEARATGNAIADTIIKPILIAATIATTGLQIAAIKAQQFAKGSYPVIGADDGKRYNAEFVGRPETGIYKKPSLGLFAEKPEMVIDYPTLRNIQLNSPALIDAILAHRKRGSGGAAGDSPQRTRQFAEGNYMGIPAQYLATSDETLEKLTKALNDFMKFRPVVAVETIERRLRQLEEIERTTGL